MSKTGSRHIKQLEVIRAHALLAEHLEVIVPQVHENGVLVTQGLVKYKPGFSDEQLAKQIAPDLPERSIAKLRQNTFGNLTSPPSGDGDAAAKIAVLETKIEDLMKANSRLSAALHLVTDRHDRLCTTLAVNQTADVRHLVTTYETVRKLA